MKKTPTHKAVRPKNVIAIDLRTAKYKKRVVASKKVYSRKKKQKED
jgi:hypothetical protein